jgi:hypothetical protein
VNQANIDSRQKEHRYGSRPIIRRVAFLIAFAVFLQTVVTLPALADPRMEIKANFCHFILDPYDTDIEAFVSGCEAVITVTETMETQNAEGMRCEKYSANGYAKVVKTVPWVAAPLAPGENVSFTIEESDTPCVMVESNGRKYKSYLWTSSIIVSETDENGMVTVVYELFCLQGQN